MATLAGGSPRKPVRSLDPDRLERVIAAASALMLVLLLAAVVRGRADWGRVPPLIWAHLATVAVALLLTPLMMLRRRGDRLHRALGWAWAAAMFATAILSLGIRVINRGGFSPIHILSLLTIVTVPALVVAARRHKIAAHRRRVRIILVAGLIVAGFFTLIPSRLLGHWLLG